VLRSLLTPFCNEDGRADLYEPPPLDPPLPVYTVPGLGVT